MTTLQVTARHSSAALAEADRLMVVCNSCRYCEGLCAVFPAMELRRTFADADLNYLANLCHGCGACFDDCQFSPPHEFSVNVPRALAAVRNDSYRTYAWPHVLSRLFVHNGLALAVIAALVIVLFVAGSLAGIDPRVLFSRHLGAGAFYRLIPHGLMVLLFGTMFLYALVALGMGAARFRRETAISSRATGQRAAQRRQGWWRALKDAATLRYLAGGRGGCQSEEQRGADTRRLFHHLAFYGFLLCFASTCVATLYHYALGREAPYAWDDLPVVLGTLGGAGLIVGPLGLLAARVRRPADYRDESRAGLDMAFLAMLFLVAFTGLALLALRDTSLMGMLLTVHMALVFAFFATMPYGKMVHGLYRYLALAHYATEREDHTP